MDGIYVCFYTFEDNPNNSLICSSISQDGSLVAGGFNDSTIKVWNMPEVEQLPGFPNTSSISIAYLQGGNMPYTLLQGHHGPVHATSFSPSGDYILSSSADSTIRLWNTNWDTNPMCYWGHDNTVCDVKFSPAGCSFASSSQDKTARVWSIDNMVPLSTMNGHLSSVDRVQWHPSGDYIATGSSDKTVRLWDASGGRCVREFTGHTSMVLSLAMSPDGRYIASGDEDGAIRLWDVGTGRCITPLLGHNSRVSTLGFSGESRLLASGSSDYRINFWDVETSVEPPQPEEYVSTNSPNALKTLRTRAPLVHTFQFSHGNALLFAAGPHW